jgi:hypothetical protein
VHAVFSAVHLPELHWPLQHSPADAQVWPSTTHAFPEQVPDTQASVQHSVDVLQLAPAAEQFTRSDAHECVVASQMLEQQSDAEVQASPNRRHVLCPWSCVDVPPLPAALPTPTPTPTRPFPWLPPALPLVPESFPAPFPPLPKLASTTPLPGADPLAGLLPSAPASIAACLPKSFIELLQPIAASTEIPRSNAELRMVFPTG